MNIGFLDLLSKNLYSTGCATLCSIRLVWLYYMLLEFFARIQFYNGAAPFHNTYYIRFGPRLRIYGILARFFWPYKVRPGSVD